jgi:hypothetical protein
MSAHNDFTKMFPEDGPPSKQESSAKCTQPVSSMTPAAFFCGNEVEESSSLRGIVAH